MKFQAIGDPKYKTQLSATWFGGRFMFGDLGRNSSSMRARSYRLAKEGGWIVAGQIAAVLGTFALIRLLTEQLNPTQYGQLALGLTVAGLVGQVVYGGISQGISRFYPIAIEKRSLHTYLQESRQLFMNGTLIVILIGSLTMIFLLLLGFNRWLGIVAAALILSVLVGCNSTLEGIQNAARQRAIVAIHKGFDSWIKVLLALAVIAALGADSTNVMVSYCITALLMCISQSYFLLRTITQQDNGLRNQTVTRLKQEIWDYAWPFSVWGSFSWGQQASSRWAIEIFGSTEVVGFYQVLTQVGFVPIQMASTLALRLISPILFARSGDASSADRNKGVRSISNKLAFAGLIGTICATGVAWQFHFEIFGLVVSEQYQGISYLMPWVTLAGGMLTISQVFGLQLAGELRTKEIMTAGVVSGLIGTALNIILTYLFGISGAVGALCAFSALNVYWLWYLASKKQIIIADEKTS